MSTGSPRRTVISRMVALLAIGGVVLAGLAAAPTAAVAAGTPQYLQLSKSVDKATPKPGETFTYSITATCSEQDCVSAQLTDPFPAGLDGFAVENVQFTPTTTPYSITWTPSGTSTPPATIGTNTGVTVDLLQSIRNGAGQGLPAGQTVTLLVSLRVPDNYPPGQGPTIVNTATVTATNSSPASDSASIAVNAPINIGVNVTKTWTPNTQAFAPGSASTIALGVGNGSNVKADKLVIQEPKTATDGAATLDPSNPFTIMDFTGFANVAIPASCTTVQVDAYVFSGGTWSWKTGPPSATLALPSGVQNSDVGGIRVTCVGTIPPGDTVSFGLGLAQRSTQRDTGADLSTASHTVNNVANGIATVGSQSATKDATASFTEAPSMPKVTTTKNIAPGQITAGQSAAGSITAANGTVPVAELRIADLGFFTTDVAFGGFTAAPAWPAGASAAKVVYHLAAGGTQEVAFAQGSTPAASSGPITGFELVFTGSPIAASTTAGANFTIQTTENATGGKPSVTLTNTATSTVTTQNGLSAQASDTAGLKILNPGVAVSIQKALRPNTAVSPGDTLIAALQTKATATGDGAIMHDIVVEDAWDKSAGGFWNAFDLEAVAPTQVPANSTLTIEVRNQSGTWVTLAVAPAQAQAFVYELNAGATTAALAALSPALTPAQVEGIRFTFHSDTGFAAATAVTPNIAFQAQSTLRTGGSSTPGPNRPTSYTNAATAHVDGKTAGNRTLTADASTTAPGSIVTQQNPPGPGPDIRKTWNKQYIDAQSSEQASTNLIWHVSSGFSPVTITDPAGSEDTPKNTVFDAFDLVGVAAIPASGTPYSNGWYLKYDTVTDVQLYDSATHTWVSAPVPAGGWMSTSRAFVGYTLTPAEQATTTGVRLVVAETAADTTARQAARQPGAAFDPYAPAPGSGVGAGLGSGGTDRTFTLTWQLRDVTRSDGTPVTQTSALNGGAGVVDNTVGIAATPLAGGADVTGSDHDTIAIVNQGPGVVVNKTVTPSGPLYTPVVGTPASSYPTAQWSIVGHNDSTAKASAVRLTDPATCDQTSLPGCESDVSRAFDDPFDTSRDYLNSADAPNPFERFTATKITIAASIPAQTDLSKATVWLLHYQPGTPGTYTTTTDTAANVNGYSESQLADVVGISVTFSGVSAQNTGLITQDNNLSILVDSRMRPTLRSSGADQVLPAGKTVDVLNRAFAQSYDPVLAPDGTPGAKVGDVSDATITLTGGSVDIRPSKSISPSLVPEPAKADPVTVTLGATSGTGTLAPNKVVIEDYAKATDFWNTFDFAALGAVTMPAGADRVQVDAVVNGAWVLGASAAAAALPQGVDSTAIQGLRFTFSRADGGLFSQTLPAASWNTSVSFTAHVRATDRTSGAPIVFDHTVDNTQTSQSTRVDGNDSPAVDAQANVTLSKGTHQLAVNKLTNGGNRQAAVGATVPFDLTFQNTGTGFLTVSQLTDALPAQLIPGDTAPVYTKQSGGSLSDQVSMSVAPDGRTITFTWPSGGNQMKPNEVFAIRLYLVLQPGLAQGATATNTMTVSTLEQLTNCRNIVSGGSTTGAWASDPTTCGTTDYVGAVAGPNLFTAKGVKGALPGAYRPDGSGLACVANLQATGGPYFRSPCVANSEVGGTDEWVLNNVNAGTVPVSQMTIFDQLPTPGDSFLITGGDRGSQFRPELVAGSLATDVPAGTTQTTEVTTSSNVCVGTWTNLVTAPVCEQSGEVWSVPDGSTDWTKVTGIRVTLDFTTTAAGALLSGQSANVTYSTLNALETASNPTGAATSVPATDQIVWNQYGVKYLDASKSTAQKIAPNAVASHLRFGSIEVAKKVTGPAASYAPASFLADVVCTAGTVPLDLGADSTVELNAGNGYTARIDGIPLSAAGTSCTVTEQGSVGKFGETSRTGSPTTLQVTEAAPQDGSAAAVPAAQIATITNDYQFTGLSVTKKVDTEATTGSFGPFGFTLSCTTATGAPVLLDGTSTTLPFTIATAGGTWTAPADRIPVGSSCTLTEVNRSAADHTVIVGDNVVDQGSGVATITPGTTSAVVTVTNGYDAGTLTVAKQVTGTGAALYGTGSFDFTAVCTYRSQQLLDEAFSLRGGDTKTFGTFPAGTSCAVTEKTTGGATDASMSPAGGTVTIAAPTAPAPVSNVVVTATNRFDLASFDVIKSRLGNLLNPGAAGPFTVDAVCTYVVDGVVTPLTVPGGAERQLTADNTYRTSYADLPVGATCDVTETETQHAGSTTVTVDNGTPVAGTSGTVELLDAATVPQMTIANTFTAGTLSVTKTVSGTAAPDHANDVFGVSLACTWYGTAIAIPGGAERDLTVATPVVYTDLPTDAQCVLTETRTGNANQVTVTSNHALLTAADSVTIAADTTLGINVDNRFDKPLPATGVDGRTVTLVGALGLIAMLGGILLFLGRRRRRA